MNIYAIIGLLTLHCLCDFGLQNDQMAINKSTSFKWLTYHAVVYTIPFMFIGWQFALVNGVAHWCVDGCTSRITSYLWKNNDRHNFFLVIGIDQWIHTVTLILTYNYFFN
jgi:hypothetical protein